MLGDPVDGRSVIETHQGASEAFLWREVVSSCYCPLATVLVQSGLYEEVHVICFSTLIFPQNGPNTLLKEKPKVMSLINSFHLDHHLLSLTHLLLDVETHRICPWTQQAWTGLQLMSLEDKGAYEKGHLQLSIQVHASTTGNKDYSILLLFSSIQQ